MLCIYLCLITQIVGQQRRTFDYREVLSHQPHVESRRVDTYTLIASNTRAIQDLRAEIQSIGGRVDAHIKKNSLMIYQKMEARLNAFMETLEQRASSSLSNVVNITSVDNSQSLVDKISQVNEKVTEVESELMSLQNNFSKHEASGHEHDAIVVENNSGSDTNEILDQVTQLIAASSAECEDHYKEKIRETTVKIGSVLSENVSKLQDKIYSNAVNVKNILESVKTLSEKSANDDATATSLTKQYVNDRIASMPEYAEMNTLNKRTTAFDESIQRLEKQILEVEGLAKEYKVQLSQELSNSIHKLDERIVVLDDRISQKLSDIVGTLSSIEYESEEGMVEVREKVKKLQESINDSTLGGRSHMSSELMNMISRIDSNSLATEDQGVELVELINTRDKNMALKIQETFATCYNNTQDLRSLYSNLEHQIDDIRVKLNKEDADLPPGITQWSAWTRCIECSEEATKTRTRGIESESISCYVCPKWSEWSTCSFTCGFGIKFRQRSLNDEPDFEKNTCFERSCTTSGEPEDAYRKPVPNNNHGWKREIYGDLLLIGGKTQSRLGPELTSLNLLSLENHVIISTDEWLPKGGPKGGFYRHCTVTWNGGIYVLGGQYTKREVYQIFEDRIEMLRVKLPYDMILHKCAVFNNKIWACSPSRNSGENCLSLSEHLTGSKLEVELNVNHFNGGLVVFNDYLAMVSGGVPKTETTEIIQAGAGKWHQWATLDRSIAGFQILKVDNSIYITGGYNGKTRENTIRSINVSCYNTQCNNMPTWKKIGYLQVKRDCHLSIAFQNNIYTLGGSTKTAIADEIFDIKTNGTRVMSTMRETWCFTGVMLSQ